MGFYSIRELEKLSGVKAHTIRIWEQRYHLFTPNRTDTNIRYYNDEQLKLILNVSLLLKNGHKISKVSALKPTELHEQIDAIYNKSTYDSLLDDKINGLLAAMIELDESHFEKIFSSVVLRIGFEETVLRLVYPFLEKVGLMWGINKINPAQEHFISNLIRQKIIAAIDGQTHRESKPQKFMLFLPEGELHEMGLLMAHYLLRSWGLKVYYLGQNVPINDVAEIYKTVQPDFVLLFFVSSKINHQPQTYLNSLKKVLKKSTIYFSGNAELLNHVKPTGNLVRLSSFADFKEIISSLA